MPLKKLREGNYLLKKKLKLRRNNEKTQNSYDDDLSARTDYLNGFKFLIHLITLIYPF
jgi:hypothetical protein